MYTFVANQQEFERTHDYPIALTVPAPRVRVVSVKRATSDVTGDCANFTFADIEVSMPAGSKFGLDELGFVFRSEPGKPQNPHMAFPNFPITSRHISPDGKTARFSFGLVDPPSARSRPFVLKLDVLAINEGLQLSTSTTVLITHP